MILSKSDLRDPLWKLKKQKNKKHLDGFSPTHLKTPPPPHAPPPKVDYVFFSPLFYHSFPIFRHNFYIKSKNNKKQKKHEKWTRPETPPLHCGLNPSKCFFKLPLNPFF